MGGGGLGAGGSKILDSVDSDGALGVTRSLSSFSAEWATRESPHRRLTYEGDVVSACIRLFSHGTYTPPPGAWFLRAADDSHGTYRLVSDVSFLRWSQNKRKLKMSLLVGL